MKIQRIGKHLLFCALSVASLLVWPSLGFSAAATAAPTPTKPTTQHEVAKLENKLEPIGQVIWVKGIIEAAQPGVAERPLQRRSFIYEHDTVTTTPGSTGEIAFTDSSIVSLPPNTQIKVDQYQYKKNPEDKAVMKLLKGGFRTITGAIPKENPDNYQVNTPVATIGVRGTQFTALLSRTKGLLMQIERGKLFVRNAKGEMILEKCDAAHATKCKMYGVVTNATSTPQTLDKQPIELTVGQPALTPVPANFAAPGNVISPSTNDIGIVNPGTPPGGGPGGGPGSPGAPGSPSNGTQGFCIGSNSDGSPCKAG